MTRLDPTNEQHPHILTSYADEFAAAAQRGVPTPPNTASWAGRVAAVTAAILAIFAGIATMTTPTVSADVAVVRADGSVTVELRGGTDAAEVAAALRAAGIDSYVTDVPTGPSAVHKFVSLSNDEPTQYLGCHSAPCDSTTVRFADHTAVTLRIGVGVPGGPYQHYTDGFAEGEPFEEVASLLGQPYDEVRAQLFTHAAAKGVTLTEAPAYGETLVGIVMTSPHTAVIEHR